MNTHGGRLGLVMADVFVRLLGDWVDGVRTESRYEMHTYIICVVLHLRRANTRESKPLILLCDREKRGAQKNAVQFGESYHIRMQ